MRFVPQWNLTRTLDQAVFKYKMLLIYDQIQLNGEEQSFQ